jgi:hypothetical protein
MPVSSHSCDILDCDETWSHSIGIHLCSRCAQALGRWLKKDPPISDLRSNITCKITPCNFAALYMFRFNVCRYHLEQLCKRCKVDECIWAKPRYQLRWKPLLCSSSLVQPLLDKIFMAAAAKRNQSE